MKIKHAIIVFTLGLGFWVSPKAYSEEGRRPNILFAFADDWGRQASIYAKLSKGVDMNEVINTPHFDRVAQEGVVFRNAFVTAPSCTPCRSSILSGQYFFRTGLGAILQGARWDESIPTFPQLLKDSGYHIGETYKVWSPGTPADAQFGSGEHAYEKAGRRFNAFSQNVTRMMAEGKSKSDAKRVLFEEVEQNFDMFLADRDSDQPFCYWFGPTLVHRKWVQGSGKELWGIDPDLLKGKMPSFLPDVHEIREDLADYFGEIQAFDTALGLLLKKLEAMGELDNTLVVVSGDHGPPGFPRGKCNLYDFGTAVPLAIRFGKENQGRVLDDFVNLMDLGPTFLDVAGVDIPAVMTGKSLLPLLNSSVQTGFADPSRNWVITGRERHVARARAGQLPYPQRALRTEDFLYIINFEPERWPMGDPAEGPVPDREALIENTFATFADFDSSPTKAWMVENKNHPDYQQHFELGFGKRPEEELYQVLADPDQVSNVAGQAAFEEVRKELRQRLLDELKRMGDPRVTGDRLTFERPPFAGE